MKRIIVLLLLIIFCLCGCSSYENINDEPITNITEVKETAFVKSVWITYYELCDMIKGKSEEEFRSSFYALIDNVKELGFNRLTVQVRAFSDAFYKSSVYPTSSYIVENQGDELSFDPLSIICEISSKFDIDVEAWINPYRVSLDRSFDKLSDKSIIKSWDNTDNLFVLKNGIYLNPAKKEVNNLIVSGVKELIDNYDIKSIHFDDYFYPSNDKSIDLKLYNESNTKLNLNDWRRQNVTNMITKVKKVIKESNKNIQFGISPSANIDENKNTLFADVEKWVSNNEILDYICPQIYYGFKNETMPFMFVTKKWCEITSVDMYVGLPLYKVGKEDKYAGDFGKNEFKQDGIVERQIEYLSKIENVKGIYVFSYSSIKGHENELQKLKEI